MVDNFSHAKPKPIRDNTPDPCEIVLKGHFGSDGALMASEGEMRYTCSIENETALFQQRRS